MKVVYSERVKTVLSTLSSNERERVRTWLRYLQNWEQDPFVRTQSVELRVNGKAVYLFRTSTDIRIFYTVDQESQTIHVVDVTEHDTIVSSGSPVGGT